jgi:chaperonin GroES
LYNSFFPNFPILHSRFYQQTVSHTFNHNGKLDLVQSYALQSLEGRRRKETAPSASSRQLKACFNSGTTDPPIFGQQQRTMADMGNV